MDMAVYSPGPSSVGIASSYSTSPSIKSSASTPTLGSFMPQLAASSTGATASDIVPPSFAQLAQHGPGGVYLPPQHHWFYKKEIDKKTVWVPFSVTDSLALEEAFHSSSTTSETLIATDGGRYEVNIFNRQRHPVYWEEEPVDVRRSSWFYRNPNDNKFLPYNEDFSARLEEEYYNAVTMNAWHKHLEFPGGHTVVMHSPNVMVHKTQPGTPDEWENVPDGQIRPRVVKRGVEEFEIKIGEPTQIDHLVFMVHGIGSFCDFRFRPVVEVVDDFRTMSQQMLQTHFRSSLEESHIGRVEFLPVSWHDKLHSDDMGTNSKLQPVTLRTIPKMRFFMNDTLLDILFYTSPVYCQIIMDTVSSEINRMYKLFRAKNPNFCGKVSLVGHSLGALILFDLLQNQPIIGTSSLLLQKPILREEPDGEKASTVSRLKEVFEELGISDCIKMFEEEKIDMAALQLCTDEDMKEMGVPLGPRKKILAYVKENHDAGDADTKTAARISEREPDSQSLRRGSIVSMVNYTVGPAGTGQPSIIYPKLDFQPSAFFAMGSPVGMFVAVRGIDKLSEDFQLPTCPSFYNIFHPFDPVAYRIEPLIDASLMNVRPVLIPHHKGRKRMHLELKETMARVGADIKAKLYDSLKNTWNTLSQFAQYHKGNNQAIEQEVDKALEEEMKKETEEELESTASVTDGSTAEDVNVGQLNGGHRIDYVLQEAPLESFNEYLFALASHCCYWESEDTTLMILKEIYQKMEVYPDVNKSVPASLSASQCPSPSMSRVPSYATSQSPLQDSAALPSYTTFTAPQAAQFETHVSSPTSSQTVPSGDDRIQQPESFSQSANIINKNFSNSMQQVHSPMYTFPTAPHQGVISGSFQAGEPPNLISSRPVDTSRSQGAGMDPTQPLSSNKPVGPPPMGGFVRQSTLGRR